MEGGPVLDRWVSEQDRDDRENPLGHLKALAVEGLMSLTRARKCSLKKRREAAKSKSSK